MRVREHRETAAGNAVKAKRNLLDEARRLLKEKEKALADYRKWRIQKEESLYGEVKDQNISLKELDDLKLKIVLLREKETELEHEILKAEQARDKAEDELSQAMSAYRKAIREKKKIEEHREKWLEEASLEEERERDKELEEYQKMKSIFHESEDDDV